MFDCKTAIEIARSERNLIQVFAAFFVPGLDGLDGITPHAKIIKSTHNTCMLLNLQFQIHYYKIFRNTSKSFDFELPYSHGVHKTGKNN